MCVCVSVCVCVCVCVSVLCVCVSVCVFVCVRACAQDKISHNIFKLFLNKFELIAMCQGSLLMDDE